MNFIQGEKFYDVADFIFSINCNNDYNYISNTFDINKLKNINIIYTHTMYIDNLFNIIRNLDNKFIVISHNSDITIMNLNNLPKNVIKWYSQNMCVSDERVCALPIGLENNRWFKELKKKEKMIEISKTDKKEKLIYMNHNINTNYKERIKPYMLFKNKSWVDFDMSYNGQNFDHYLNNIYNHKFVISPSGNGIDTHRRWECLYLNTIPIEIKNGNNIHFKDLPICFINDWSEITENFLDIEYKRIKNSNWNIEKLDMDYWKKIIIKDGID